MLRLLQRFDGQTPLGAVRGDFALSPEAVWCLAALVELGILTENGRRCQAATMPQTGPTLTLFPTTDCNLRCLYCYASAGERARQMPPEVYGPAIDSFLTGWLDRAVRVSLLLHGGGEPTSCFHLSRAIWAEFKRKCDRLWIEPKLEIGSNGVFSTEAAKWLVENQADVVISLDGPPEVHDRQRPFRDGRPSFEQVTANIRYLVEAGTAVRLRTTVTTHSLPRALETVELAHSLGVTVVKLDPLSLVGRAQRSGLSSPEPAEFADTFLRCFHRGVELGVRVRFSAFGCLDPPIRRFCGACGANMVVTPEGYVTACFEAETPDDPAAEVFFIGRVDPAHNGVEWFSDRIERLRGRTVENMKPCANCFAKYGCAGWCPMKAFRLGGDILCTDERWCAAIKEINGRAVVWVANGHDVGPWGPVTRRRLSFEC